MTLKPSLFIIFEILLLVAGFVIGVLGIFPLPVLPLVLVAWFSLRYRHLSWRDVGLRRPDRWLPTIALALLFGVGYQVLDTLLIGPVLQRLTGTSIDLSQFKILQGNLLAFIGALALTWTEAAFIEEMFFRGYLFNRIGDLAGQSRIGIVSSLLVSSLVFGIAHAYQGLTGVLDIALAGIMLGLLYLFGKRNLWLPILTHGIIDTIGFVLIYAGLVTL